MIEIFANTELIFETDSIAYRLSATLDINTNKYHDPYLAFVKNFGMYDEKYIEDWDMERYLIETLYTEVLLPWVTDKTIPKGEDFTALLKIDGVRLEDFKGIYELFNKAIELKFFEK